MSFSTDVALHVLAVVLFAVAMLVIHGGQESRERVAYLEGRYGLDHSAAVHLAAAEEVR